MNWSTAAARREKVGNMSYSYIVEKPTTKIQYLAFDVYLQPSAFGAVLLRWVRTHAFKLRCNLEERLIFGWRRKTKKKCFFFPVSDTVKQKRDYSRSQTQAVQGTAAFFPALYSRGGGATSIF